MTKITYDIHCNRDKWEVREYTFQPATPGRYQPPLCKTIATRLTIGKARKMADQLNAALTTN